MPSFDWFLGNYGPIVTLLVLVLFALYEVVWKYLVNTHWPEQRKREEKHLLETLKHEDRQIAVQEKLAEAVANLGRLIDKISAGQDETRRDVMMAQTKTAHQIDIVGARVDAVYTEIAYVREHLARIDVRLQRGLIESAEI